MYLFIHHSSQVQLLPEAVFLYILSENCLFYLATAGGMTGWVELRQ